MERGEGRIRGSVWRERKRGRENGKKERRKGRRKKGALARNNAQSHREECGPSGYTRIHGRSWWVPIGRPSILFFPTGRRTPRLFSAAGDKYTGEFTALPVVTSFGLFQVNRARAAALRIATLCRSRWTRLAGSTQMTIRHIAVLGSSYFFF